MVPAAKRSTSQLLMLPGEPLNGAMSLRNSICCALGGAFVILVTTGCGDDSARDAGGGAAGAGGGGAAGAAGALGPGGGAGSGNLGGAGESPTGGGAAGLGLSPAELGDLCARQCAAQGGLECTSEACATRCVALESSDCSGEYVALLQCAADLEAEDWTCSEASDLPVLGEGTVCEVPNCAYVQCFEAALGVPVFPQYASRCTP